MKSKRFTFVDALRGLGALAVVMFHGVEGNHLSDFPQWAQAMLRHGDLGVAVFFVLSGFVIAHSLRKQRMTVGGVLHFMARRSIRLEPPYWAAIILMVGVLKAKGVTDLNQGQIVAHLFYVQDLLGYGDLNPVFWTLCLEVQFYLVFALLLMLPRMWFVAAFAISLLWPLGILLDAQHGLFLPLWYGFLLGVLAYWSWENPKLLPLFSVYAGLIAVGSVIRWNPFGLTCVVTSSVILTVARSGRITTLLDWRWLQFLGAISYSLYLFHNPVTGVTFRLANMLSTQNVLTEAIWWVVSIMASIGVAAIVYYAIERPSMRLSRLVGVQLNMAVGRA